MDFAGAAEASRVLLDRANSPSYSPIYGLQHAGISPSTNPVGIATVGFPEKTEGNGSPQILQKDRRYAGGSRSIGASKNEIRSAPRSQRNFSAGTRNSATKEAPDARWHRVQWQISISAIGPSNSNATFPQKHSPVISIPPWANCPVWPSIGMPPEFRAEVCQRPPSLCSVSLDDARGLPNRLASDRSPAPKFGPCRTRVKSAQLRAQPSPERCAS